MTTSRLNLGCGTDVREGWVNVDRIQLPGVDIIHDIEELPLPFPGDSFDYVLCQDILEHVNYIPVLRDIWRIMKVDGTLHVRVPHFTSPNAYGDPTHKQFFNRDTFRFFVSGNPRSYYFKFSFAHMKALHICFGIRAYLPLQWFVNLSPRTQRFYEISPLRVFPASNIEVDLIK